MGQGRICFRLDFLPFIKSIEVAAMRRTARIEWGLGAVFAAVLVFLSTTEAAGPYSFSTLDAPAGSLTVACGIDIVGRIVGYYEDGTGTHGFLLNNGGFSTIDFPGAAWT